jgi:hypothetical protein
MSTSIKLTLAAARRRDVDAGTTQHLATAVAALDVTDDVRRLYTDIAIQAIDLEKANESNLAKDERLRAKDERLRAKDNLIAAYQAAEYVTFLAERAAILWAPASCKQMFMI